MRNRILPLGAFVGALFLVASLLPAGAEPPKTTAEATDYKQTSRYAEVVSFCEKLAKESPLIRLGTLGTSHEGRKLPLVILADPPIATPEEAARSKKLVVFAFGNIHAGEVDGKEALLMLVRDLALAKERPLLKDLILVFAPIFNADGNEKFAKNRPTQGGPEEVGIRANAQGFDLNRDYVKLESPEVRSMVRFLNKWDPAVIIDCHTTNGSYHRYAMTYEGGGVPAGDAKVITFVRDELLAEVTKRMEKKDKIRSYFYGNFSPDRSQWQTVPPTPRYGTHYFGLHNRISILSESYTYDTFQERVRASRAFVSTIIDYTAENKEKIRKLLEDARQAAVKAGKDLKADDKVPLRYKAAPLGRPHELLGYVEEVKDGKRVRTDKTKEYSVQYMGGTETTLAVRRPYAYLVPAGSTKVIENLQRHGLDLEELREDIELDVEAYTIDKITRGREFQKHQLVTLEATPRKQARLVKAGTVLVRTAQPLGPLAVYLLEPQSMDGLATWNFFDADVKEGSEFPVLRLPAAVAITTGKVRPLAEERVMNKPITYDLVYKSGRSLNFNGTPVTGLTWLPDGKHFLQVKQGKLLKVEADTGRTTPFFDAEKLADGLATLPTIKRSAAGSLAASPNLRMNPARTGTLFIHENDLYYCNLDGTGAARPTKSPGSKELVTFSPDGKFVAFVRDNNLFVVDVATKTERLTTDGSVLISNGKADWVYFEEVSHRGYQAYSWSPDSSRIAFARFDDTPVRKFPVVDHLPTRANVETTPYPKSGDPNPLVKLGVVTAAGGPVVWADLSDYSDTARILLRADWTPDSQNVYVYVTDRTQTWLDFCLVPRDDGKTTRLFRETTKAWIDDPGAPTFLKDGSFLFASQRSGWKHLYHYDKAGKLKAQVTTGDWETRTLHVVDEEGGWIYFSGTRDSHLGLNLYRIKLDGTNLERLTNGAGEHRVSVSPKGTRFLDTCSNHQTPNQVRLHDASGQPVRTIDTNPIYIVEEYRRGPYEMVQIKTDDGFLLEGSILKPPDFDPKKKYPVWFMTYGGPHAPTVHDNWGGGRLRDEVLAQMGFVVFRCDPRSASGKGACSTWTAYRQLGVQELKDIETAIRWLTKEPFIDAARVGMSGHSYGGFMTAYALTHSKLFAAGVAGAPVTDWRNYDSIYTERYMNTPQENPDGYKATSVVRAASNLHGRLLLIHGLMDDNVHVQNSVQLVEALQRADKDFEVMFYPRARHGIFGAHYQRLVIDFMKRTLKP